MLGIQQATDALRATLHNKGVESHVQDAFDNLASYLVLLNSSSPSVQMLRKLCTVLRRPLLPLYNASLGSTLQLSSSVLSIALGKLCNADNNEDESLRAAWDETAEVILSGILDFLDQKDRPNAESDDVVWEVLYHVIGEFFFPACGREPPTFSIPLCLSAYNTLTEVAAGQISIRNAFRQNSILGGERLGAAISRTRDYLPLEALLMLFARLIPPTNNTPQGKLGRVKFIKEVLGSPKLFKCSSELLDIMQNASTTQWDDVAAQIIDVLAWADITYPQPFSIDEIHVCGRVFPQPLATDRLVMDRQAFLANIVAEDDDVCESLQVPYSRIRTITLDNSEKNVPKGKTLIVIYLTSPPLIANVEMNSPDASHLHAKFTLQSDAVSRFMEALRRRGVGKLNFLNPLPKVERKRKSISIGSGFKLTNDSSPVPPTASFEGKVQYVNEVYRTDIEDQTVSHLVGILPTPDPKPPFKDEGLIPEVLESAMAEDVPAPAFSFPGNSTRTAKSSGDSDELSEISEFEADKNTASEQAAKGESAAHHRESKPAQHRGDSVRMSESSTPSKKIDKPSDSASRPVKCTEAVAQRPPETGKLPLTSDFPRFRSSSSTRISDSPRILPDSDIRFTRTDTKAIGSLSETSQDFGPSEGLSSAKDELRRQLKPFSPSACAHQELCPPVEVKIVGSRRKRESVKSLSNPITEVDDEHTPPRKKRREEGLRMEEDRFRLIDTSLEVVPISRVKYTKAAKRSSIGTDPVARAPKESAGLKPNRQGTRRSSRIKRKQTATSGRTRPDAAPCRVKKEKQTGDQLARSAEHNELTVFSPKIDDAEVDDGTVSPLASCPIPPVVREFPSPRLNSQLSLVEVDNVEAPKTKLPREMPKCNPTLAYPPSQPRITLGKEPRVRLEEAPSYATKPVQQQRRVDKEGFIKDGHPPSDVRVIDEEIGRVREVVEYAVSLKEGKDFAQLSRPIVKSETVTIDLTIDDSPTRGETGPHKASVDLVHPEADIQTKFMTPDLAGNITMEGITIVPSSRHRRRSVTFASPIEYVLEKKVKSKTHADSCSYQLPSPSEGSTLFPLRKTTGTARVRRESPGRISRIASQCSAQSPVRNQSADGAEIQDIVKVLNDIQAVIIKGISDRFKNVKKDVQRSRDELIQQVLDALRSMLVENAKYFNGLLRLEEDYHKNCKTIIHCWEELIDRNDGIAAVFQDALKEHDQAISARTFPKSLLPMQPVFSRRTNA